MQLLIAVINREEHIDDILTGFLELGITGATMVASEGMGHVLASDMPIFAGVRALHAHARPENRTLFCVAEDEKIEAAVTMIQNVCGDLNEPGVGICFVLPVARVVGLAPELDG